MNLMGCPLKQQGIRIVRPLLVLCLSSNSSSFVYTRSKAKLPGIVFFSVVDELLAILSSDLRSTGIIYAMIETESR
jgi:hypothetical protein